MVDFLVVVAVLLHRSRTSGNGDDGRPGQVRILQPGSQVGGADVLGHTDAGPVGGPRVSVGHVRSSLLAVGHDTAYAHLLHLYQRSGHNHRHIKGVGYPVRLHHLHHKFGSGHPWHNVPSLDKYHRCARSRLDGLRPSMDAPVVSIILVCPPGQLYGASYAQPRGMTSMGWRGKRGRPLDSEI